MFNVVNFDLFDASAILEVIFGLEPSDTYLPYNDYFEELGYDNSNFIYLIGPPVLSVIFYLFLLLLYVIIMKIQ